MTALLWMDIPALNTTAQYPSDGKGGITTTAASALGASFKTSNFRFLGVIVLGQEGTGGPVTVTLTDSKGGTYTLSIPDGAVTNEMFIGSFLPLPEFEGITADGTSFPSADIHTLGAGAGAAVAGKVPLYGGIPVGPTFTLAQDTSTSGGSSIRGLFVADE